MINLQNEVCIMADGNHLDSISEQDKKQKRLELILKSAGVGTWEWNIQTGESIYNERWAEILGYTLAELEPTDANTWIAIHILKIWRKPIRFYKNIFKKIRSIILLKRGCDIRMDDGYGYLIQDE